MGLINDVAQDIHNQGIAILGSNLFIGHMPDSPDTCVAVYETGGLQPSIELPTNNPTFQVLIRATTYEIGRAIMASIRSHYHQLYNTRLVPGGTYFYSINVQGEGGALPRDPNELDLFSINFMCKTR